MVPTADSERTASFARQVVQWIEKSDFSTILPTAASATSLCQPPRRAYVLHPFRYCTTSAERMSVIPVVPDPVDIISNRADPFGKHAGLHCRILHPLA